MLSLNFDEALSRILAYLPKKRRTYLFSATMTSKVAKLEKASLRDPAKVQVSEHKFATVELVRGTGVCYCACPPLTRRASA